METYEQHAQHANKPQRARSEQEQRVREAIRIQKEMRESLKSEREGRIEARDGRMVTRHVQRSAFGDGDILHWSPPPPERVPYSAATRRKWQSAVADANARVNGFSQGGKPLRRFLREVRSGLEALREELFRSYEEWLPYEPVLSPEEQRLAQMKAEDRLRSEGTHDRVVSHPTFGDEDIFAWKPPAESDPVAAREWARVKNVAQGEINAFQEGGQALTAFLRALRARLEHDRERLFVGSDT